MEAAHKLEKWIWTNADFDVMGWHDCRVHGIAFYPEQFELAFDLDYIFQWVDPQPNETHFKFWVAPATLVFTNVHDVEFDLDSYSGKLEIDNIKREDESVPINAQFFYWSLED